MDQPKLSTMVVLYNTNLKFDTNKIMSDLPLDTSIIKIEKRGVARRGESQRDKIKRRSTKTSPSNTTGFCHNSITVVVLNDGDGTLPQKEITIKIFQNGVFHLTGILDPRYDTCSMRILLNSLWTKCRESIIDAPEKYEIMKRRVVLMNYTTKLSSNQTVPRELMFTNIRNLGRENVTCAYDPDVYPGAKIRIGPKNWIAKVFRTGKIILTGITDHDEVVEFVRQLSCLLAEVLPQAPKLQTQSVLAVLP
jgi:TATA-box binding protein (TBP) (component of TFIID and TFIIIB)